MFQSDHRASDQLILRSSRRLDEIPRNFFDVSNALSISSLDLSCNNLTKIPNEIRCLRHLITMDASHNQLGSLPSQLAGLQKLKSLDMSFNRISNVAAEPLVSCTALSTLRLAGNGLKQLHSRVAFLPSLSLLDISQNGAIVISADTPSQQHCDHPVSTPDRSLPSNAEAGGAENEITKSGLERTARDGGLKSLLAGCCGGAQTIEGIGDWALSGLNILSLHLNQLTQAPLTRCMTALRRLVLDSNNISTLPDMGSTLQNLENLFIANNHLTQVPSSLSSLTSLVNVDMCFNSITDNGLPSAVSAIVQGNDRLQSFLLYGNPIARSCIENGARHPGGQDEQLKREKDKEKEEGQERHGLHAEEEEGATAGGAMKQLLHEITALILAGSYQAALLLLYDRVFRAATEIPAGVSLMLRAVPVLTGVDGQACGGHCWASTHRTSPQVLLVQVREALLIRGPFALILLTLGHELVHVRQMLGKALIGEAEREFEAFSWMLLEGAQYPPLVHEDRIWILQRAEGWYTRMNSETQRRHAERREALLLSEARAPLVITH